MSAAARGAAAFVGLVPYLKELAQAGEENSANQLDELLTEVPCAACHGRRLNPRAQAVQVAGKTIWEVAGLCVDDARAYFAKLDLDHSESATAARDRAVSENVMKEILPRLNFLSEVGLPYLTLDRRADTLSGGEAQRIRLAAQLGSNLRGVCYILDEPTIGLHPRDNAMLLEHFAPARTARATRAGRRARRGDHPVGRSGHRPRSRRRRARRRPGGDRHAGGNQQPTPIRSPAAFSRSDAHASARCATSSKARGSPSAAPRSTT